MHFDAIFRIPCAMLKVWIVLQYYDQNHPARLIMSIIPTDLPFGSKRDGPIWSEQFAWSAELWLISTHLNNIGHLPHKLWIPCTSLYQLGFIPYILSGYLT